MVYEIASWVLLLYLLFLLAAFCFFCFKMTEEKKEENKEVVESVESVKEADHQEKIDNEMKSYEEYEKDENEEAIPLISNAMSAEIGEKEADDLKKIKGIGVKLEKLLNSLGVYTFKQIAEWTKEDVAKIDAYLKFPGRIERDEWIKQAKEFLKDKK